MGDVGKDRRRQRSVCAQMASPGGDTGTPAARVRLALGKAR